MSVIHIPLPTVPSEPPDPEAQSPIVELGDIFRKYGKEFRAKNKLSRNHHKVLSAIEGCRTGALGYHVDICDGCGYTEHEYNSCRNRHCPQCQSVTRWKWVRRQLDDLLPVPYDHAVFTLPHKINLLASYNEEFIYELLLSSASSTLLQFGHDPKWLGALIGFFGILHTWGGKLWKHLHVHFLVTCGGLSDDGRWLTPKYKGKFLFPVHALSDVFRGKFIKGLKEAYYKGELVIPSAHNDLKSEVNFERWVDELVAKKWVVYSKSPLSDSAEAVSVIGRYMHKTTMDDNRLLVKEQEGVADNRSSSSFIDRAVGYIGKFTNQAAITNDQILSIKDGFVHFKFKNYRKKGRWEDAKLDVEEFIRRFLSHVLPTGFHRVRHYGFLANGKRKTMIKKIREALKSLGIDSAIPRETKNETYTPGCPSCKKGSLRTVLAVSPMGKTTVFQTNVFLVKNQRCPDTS